MTQSLLRCITLSTGLLLTGLGLSPVHGNRIAVSNLIPTERTNNDSRTTIPTEGNSNTQGILLPEGTRITLQLFEDVSSKDQTKDRVVQWGVYKDVRPPRESAVLVLAGAYADGKVTAVRRGGVFGRPGHIAVNVTTVEAVDGQRIPVYCKPLEEQGKDRRALAWCLGIGLTIVGIALFSTLTNGGGLFLLAVLPMFFGLFISGKDVTLERKSTLIEVTVQRDMIIKA